MKLKPFIILIYVIAGLLISASSAFMTYVIIGAHIGQQMIIKIVFTVLFSLPIIGLISYVVAKFLSKKFEIIQKRIEKIKQENFSITKEKNFICEVNNINEDINFLSLKLDKLISDLKEKNSNLSTLLISMSHDIKTPITILNGYVDEIADEMIKKEDMPFALEKMKNEINFLDELTVDMVEYISSMKNQKTKNSINLYEFIENEILILLPKEQNIKYINDVNNEFIILFNKTDLKKILLNILYNAIRYTPSGYLKIYIFNDEVLIENNGEEIKEKYFEKIFQPFYTVDKSKSRENNGFGLGLSIVKNLSINNAYSCYLKESNASKTVFAITPSSI